MLWPLRMIRSFERPVRFRRPSRVDPAQVAGGQPAVGGEGLRVVRRIDEAGEQVGRLEQHHAVLAGRQRRDRSRCRARRARRCACCEYGKRKPDAARPARSTPGGVMVEMPAISVMPRLSCTCRPIQPLEARGQLRRQRRGAGAAVAERRDVGAGERHVGQRRQHRRHRRQRASRGASRPAASSCAITSRLRISDGVGITTSTPADSEASEPGSTPATWNSG